ncbi:serine hydrolase domain-containing protein [Brevundimonas sp.]|uniref:Beta-lactamase family protein n=1 Tax=Brevundimonas mediterranea TaxID=74329 RepID=A0AB37EAP0_9CAUL|nr:hypothetical protein [Brevundimonas sp.]MBU2401933.1 beta-lactamase family protein [Alphaproteobacteria bacterium]QIH74526.1 beta-lactamase family protein [Brevundimonas mediterranea]TAJ39740.1 MAG: class A beta-lactamase-related serine hydrolase [Brevundimonas sp.]
MRARPIRCLKQTAPLACLNARETDIRHPALSLMADSVFRIGSLTKQFTAAALLMLAEDGKLSLDAPVNRYL